MGLADVFTAAVETAFTVFADFVKSGAYIVEPDESGWTTSDVAVECEMDVIVNGLTQKDAQNTKFYAQIRETDTIVMVKGTDISKNNIRVRNSDSFKVIHKTYTQLYEIVAHDTDPAEALYLILLREKN